QRFRRTEPFPSTHASFAVRARPNEPYRSATTPPASEHRLCLPSILRLLVCFAADRIRPLRQPIREVVHRATRLASSPQTLYARVRLYSRSTDGSVRLWLRLSFPARSCLQHRSPPPLSLPGGHPSPYTCRASLDAPFWINASTLMWLLRVFSRQPPDKGRVLSYCDYAGVDGPSGRPDGFILFRTPGVT